MGFILTSVYYPDLLPRLSEMLKHFRPLANVTFYWAFAGVMALIFLAIMVSVRFDYWEVRPNELLHHHGVLSNLERFSAPNLRIDKEINDIFEYILLSSGRLILQASSERRAIILDNIPRIRKKEQAITRMLRTAVQVRKEMESTRTVSHRRPPRIVEHKYARKVGASKNGSQMRSSSAPATTTAADSRKHSSTARQRVRRIGKPCRAA